MDVFISAVLPAPTMPRARYRDEPTFHHLVDVLVLVRQHGNLDQAALSAEVTQALSLVEDIIAAEAEFPGPNASQCWEHLPEGS